MNMECINNIINDNLVINIDLTNINSWDLNTGFTVTSITKWKNAVSDNINLIDYGLTMFDVGKTNKMWEGIKLTPIDNNFNMNRIGYNSIKNPSSGETSGVTVSTLYDLYPISAVTSGDSGNYFNLNGGYLSGFFKLDGYNYELLPSRYNNGITIETLIYLYPETHGIFYLMGVRSEDKYNPHFSGETISGDSGVVGVFSSEDNYLDSFIGTKRVKKSFKLPEDNKITTYSEPNPIDNIKDNLIAFEITRNRNLGYKYINNGGLVVSDSSNYVLENTGFTLITITYSPYTTIVDPDILECAKQRIGDLMFYVNGRCIWKTKNFPEFYFKSLKNDKEKQIGVPYNINWGGGSFGLKHSWHYDYQKYGLYDGQDYDYVSTNFVVIENPIENPIETPISGISLTVDNITFESVIGELITPITVMKIECTGSTSNSIKSCYIKYDIPISTISNREYIAELELYNVGFFKQYKPDNSLVNNKITILPYGNDTDINIVDDLEYVYPLNGNSINFITGQNEWIKINTRYLTEDNSGQKFIGLGILIESDYEFNLDSPLYFKTLTYEGADILVQDFRKNNLLVEQNFDSSFNGGIQKLRIYNKSLTSPEVLHNAHIESKNNNDLNVTLGGRIIYR